MSRRGVRLSCAARSSRFFSSGERGPPVLRQPRSRASLASATSECERRSMSSVADHAAIVRWLAQRHGVQKRRVACQKGGGVAEGGGVGVLRSAANFGMLPL